MTDQTNIEDRIRRAQNEEMSVQQVVQAEPLIVQIENASSGTRQSIVPDALHCSCADHQYRSALCKHIVFLAMREDWIAEAVRQAITDELTELQEEEQYFRERLREIESERNTYEAVREELEPVLEYEEDPRSSHGSEDLTADDINESFDNVDEMIESIQETGEEAASRQLDNGTLFTTDEPEQVSKGLKLDGDVEPTTGRDDEFTKLVDDLTEDD